MSAADSSFDRMARDAWRAKGGSNLLALSLVNDLVREFLRLAAARAREGHRVHLPGLGVVVRRTRKPRRIKGPPGSKLEGQALELPETWSLVLRPGKHSRGMGIDGKLLAALVEAGAVGTVKP